MGDFALQGAGVTIVPLGSVLVYGGKPCARSIESVLNPDFEGYKRGFNTTLKEDLVLSAYVLYIESLTFCT